MVHLFYGIESASLGARASPPAKSREINQMFHSFTVQLSEKAAFYDLGTFRRRGRPRSQGRAPRSKKDDKRTAA